MISHDSVRLQRHLQMMRSRNKIDALMVDDIHECRGSGRYRNRQIKHIVVDFPLHFRLAIWGDVRGFGMGEISPDHRSDTEPLPAGFNGFKAAVAAVLGCLTALWGWFGWLVVAWVACMLLDYATGTAAALKAGKWSCKAAREGLWHKVGAMAAVLVAAILDGVLGLILDHIPALTLPFDYTVFLTVLVLVWYILTELGSIVENAGALGAPIPAFLQAAIKSLDQAVDGSDTRD